MVHLVAILPRRDAGGFERVMIQGTRDLVEASKQAGVSASSSRARSARGGAGVVPY